MMQLNARAPGYALRRPAGRISTFSTDLGVTAMNKILDDRKGTMGESEEVRIPIYKRQVQH